MAITVLQQPAAVNLTGNDILFQLQSDLDPVNYSGISIHVEITYLDDNGVWQIAGADIKATVNGKASFYVQTYLDQRNNVPFSIPGTDKIYSHTKAITQFKIAWYEVYSSIATGEDNTSAETELATTFYAVQGGISRMDEINIKSYGFASWWAWYQSTKGFLSHRPVTEKISLEQTLKLWIINFVGSNNVILKAEITDTAGQKTTKTIKNLAVSDFNLVEFDVSPQIIFTAGELATLASYKIIIDTSVGVDQYAEKIFEVHSKYFERNCFFINQNSYGCWDGVWARGYRSELSTLETSAYAKRVRFADAAETHESQKQRAILTKKYIADFGFLLPNELPAMEDFFISGAVHYIHIEGNKIHAIPVKINTTEVPGLSDGNNMLSQPFEFELSFKNKYFSAMRL